MLIELVEGLALFFVCRAASCCNNQQLFHCVSSVEIDAFVLSSSKVDFSREFTIGCYLSTYRDKVNVCKSWVQGGITLFEACI